VKGAATANLIYLKKRNLTQTTLCLAYSSIPRPYETQSVNYFDKGYEFYLNKVGFFKLVISYNIKKSKLNSLFPLSTGKPEVIGQVVNQFEELTAEELEIEGLSKSSVNFYCLSLGL
jgi:hypothetical protein